MQFRYFAHSWISDWNHGNAHFLRGLARALVQRGHEVRVYEPMPEPSGGWSLSHLCAEAGGSAAIAQMSAAYPELDIRLFGPGARGPRRTPLNRWPVVESWEEELRNAEVVLMHEWHERQLLEWLTQQRRRWGFRLLLHDTHHRAVSDGCWLRQLPLGQLDGVLAFGESLRQMYERTGRVRHSYTLHEAADLLQFHPGAAVAGADGVVWIGNWGDGERDAALEEFLLQPVENAAARLQTYGVRYPERALARLRQLQAGYGGYLPNLEAPAAYGRAAVTVHVPRGPYAGGLAGIPTIRMFEAMACGCALLSAPWTDSEGLFAEGEDYWKAQNGREMTWLLVQLLRDGKQRKRLGTHAAASIAARHSCEQRAESLEAICRDLN
ncbi:MAG: CgeB family protein [Terriglobales bacterium]